MRKSIGSMPEMSEQNATEAQCMRTSSTPNGAHIYDIKIDEYLDKAL